MESVWDYPRPPRVERSVRPVSVRHAGVTVAESGRAWRVLETSHPPVFYVPRDDVADGVLVASAARRTVCEFKGVASYWDLRVGAVVVPAAGWSYEEPADGYAELAGAVAFYPGRVDECRVGDERVRPQEGDFYGGWITADVTGPFKGGPGTRGW
ncbi:DUF427 domain-containing protein [Spirilliplanes yamanashiensis]|uniref:DUF427 domain-containing protein n=1 Tax=Spirilliplanes yamanashiensis TaxID=42233 RepID=A0A8J4DJ68_9ACTN|nr:DUF427 domain-containing protein [Spirilliplanes yamanashiensis]MDP9816868.1 uncharacterized protein (DUF427 family) [Spirilliplanes yamanashiensis]GIJ03476.1 hypothetical protein Sya03_28280 [Spirilliplanes yamanashiensis]